MASYGVAADKLLNSLSGMCPGLDTCMRGMGQEGQADMVQDVDGMRAEIAAHVANGCAAPDLPAEMTRHRGAMDTYTHGLMTRTDYITGMMMNRGMMHWNGCQ